MRVQNKIYETLMRHRLTGHHDYYTHTEIHKIMCEDGSDCGSVSCWRAVNSLWTSGLLESKVEHNGASVRRLFRAVNPYDCETKESNNIHISILE